MFFAAFLISGPRPQRCRICSRRARFILCQFPDAMFRRRVGPSSDEAHGARERSVVDDPATLRVLAFHQPKRLLGTEKRSTQVGLDNALPLFVGHLVDFARRDADSGVIK